MSDPGRRLRLDRFEAHIRELVAEWESCPDRPGPPKLELSMPDFLDLIMQARVIPRQSRLREGQASASAPATDDQNLFEGKGGEG